MLPHLCSTQSLGAPKMLACAGRCPLAAWSVISQALWDISCPPWQRHVHGEHVDPELDLALLDAGLVRVVQGARLDVLRHELTSNLVEIMRTLLCLIVCKTSCQDLNPFLWAQDLLSLTLPPLKWSSYPWYLVPVVEDSEAQLFFLNWKIDNYKSQNRKIKCIWKFHASKAV